MKAENRYGFLIQDLLKQGFVKVKNGRVESLKKKQLLKLAEDGYIVREQVFQNKGFYYNTYFVFYDCGYSISIAEKTWSSITQLIYCYSQSVNDEEKHPDFIPTFERGKKYTKKYRFKTA
jgi:hypothetical protein